MFRLENNQKHEPVFRAILLDSSFSLLSPPRPHCMVYLCSYPLDPRGTVNITVQVYARSRVGNEICVIKMIHNVLLLQHCFRATH